MANRFATSETGDIDWQIDFPNPTFFVQKGTFFVQIHHTHPRIGKSICHPHDSTTRFGKSVCTHIDSSHLAGKLISPGHPPVTILLHTHGGGDPPPLPDYKLSAPWVARGLENFPKYKWGVGGRLQDFSRYKLPRPPTTPAKFHQVPIHVSEAIHCENNSLFLRGEGLGGQQAHTAINSKRGGIKPGWKD